MNFEEQFPSLDGQVVSGNDIRIEGPAYWKYEWISRGAVEHNCLDKQRVRTVLESFDDGTWHMQSKVEEAMKELGL